jgi:hypothetical protein
MGEHFLGSCTVASRNSLIHNGATNGTKLGRFDHEGGSRARSQGLGGYVEEPFATVNFAEFVFSRHWGENSLGGSSIFMASGWPGKDHGSLG